MGRAESDTPHFVTVALNLASHGPQEEFCILLDEGVDKDGSRRVFLLGVDTVLEKAEGRAKDYAIEADVLYRGYFACAGLSRRANLSTVL